MLFPNPSNTANLRQSRVNTNDPVPCTVSRTVQDAVTDPDYLIDSDLPPFDSIADARSAAKCAEQLDQLAKKCQDPVKSSMMKTAARALWDNSLSTYVHVFRQRGLS